MNIQLVHISKQFENELVLNDVNVTFLEGRINCLMGASGIGKTTIINIIMGLIKPDTGAVLGCNNSRIAAVFQEDRLIEHWDAVKNVRLVCEKSISIEKIEQEFHRVGLEEYWNKPVKDYSGGMKRRVALVRAMLAKSDILILDEPFKGLDDMLKKQVIQYVKEHTQEKTVIIVTHDKEEVQLLEANLISLS
jgi:NitT/TauT family transport system ATP-binding protein